MAIQNDIRQGRILLAERLTQLMNDEKLFTDPTVSRDKIAAALGTNRTYLSNCVRDTFNLTIPDYINTLRLNIAVELLKAGGLSVNIQEVAEASGFRSYTSFYRAFMKHYGMGPTDYVGSVAGKEITCQKLTTED